MLVNAGVNIYLICRYPEFEDAQRSYAQADIKTFMETHPAFKNSIVGTSAELATNNPGLLFFI
jgi:hypothetical protein